MKKCKRCGQTKPLSEYYPSPTGADGKQSICRTCDHERCREWRLKDLKAARRYARERTRGRIQKPRPPQYYENQRVRALKRYHADKSGPFARGAIRDATRRGGLWACNQLKTRCNTGPMLFRPPHCPWCGGTSPYPIEAHHYLGYEPKYWVWGTVWVCRPCHRQIDVMAREAQLDGLLPIEGFKRFLREHGVQARNKVRKSHQAPSATGYNGVNVSGENHAA